MKSLKKLSVPRMNALQAPVLMGGSLTYDGLVKRLFGSGIIDFLYLDEAAGVTAVDYSGNSLDGTYSNVGGLLLAQNLPPFTAPVLGATSYVNLNAAAIAAKFSYLTGTYLYWVKGSLALWDDAALRRLAMLQVDTNNRIDCTKSAALDSLVFDYKAASVSNTKTIANMTMTSGWIPIALRWDKAGDAMDIFVNGHLLDTVSGLGNIGGAVANATVGVNPNFPAGSLAQWVMGTTLLTDAHISQIVAKVRRDKLIVFDGDSLTVGAQAGATPYPKQMIRLYYSDSPVGNCAGYNKGNSSQTLVQMQADAAATVDIYRNDGGFRKYFCVAWGGTNDINQGETAVTVENRLEAYCLARKAAGWTVVVGTIIPNGSMTAGEQAVRATVNTWIKANYASFADGLADFTANAAFDQEADVSDGAIYNADTVHLTTAGYGLIAAIVKPVVDAL